jgi:hypothetical protein
VSEEYSYARARATAEGETEWVSPGSGTGPIRWECRPSGCSARASSSSTAWSKGFPAYAVEEAARSFPREQLGLSTQCGFASVADGNPVSEDAEQRKLRLVAEVAHAAWG